MALLKFHKVTTLPDAGAWDNNALYFLEVEDNPDEQGSPRFHAESYLTNNSGVPRALGNTDLIYEVATLAARDIMSSMNAIRYVQTIAERDEQVTPDLDTNLIVLVLDATGDPTVNAGAALYFYRYGPGGGWTKVAEYESMDVVLNWNSIQGGPLSSPTEIDDAAAKAHNHANKAVLDKFTENDGRPYFNGVAIGGSTEWATVDW